MDHMMIMRDLAGKLHKCNSKSSKVANPGDCRRTTSTIVHQWIKNHAIAVPTIVVPSKVYH